jgi:oligoendopeptidase F
VSTATQLPPPSIHWDLSTLFDSPSDPKIAATWKAVAAKAEEFARTYRGKINTPNLKASTLAQAFRDIEDITQDCAKPVAFAQLSFVTDTANPATGAFLQKQLEKGTELNVTLMFFELEIQAMSKEKVEEMLAAPEMASYRHHLVVTRTFSPYRLSEAEEIILEETANTGSRAWVRLFEEVTANQVYRFRSPDGETEELSQEEVISKLHEPDRATRLAAADAMTSGFRELRKVVVFAYNTLLQDKSVDDRLRKLPYAEHTRHLSNELKKETVDLVVSLCAKHYALVERFYTIKRKILGLPELTHVDRYAPLFEAEDQVSYEEAQEIVLDAFGRFNETMRAKASEFFEKGWIDAEPRAGKQGGAFCMYVTPDTHPYIFSNYLNKIDDVMTLAHELGHGVHSSLSREQTYFNFHGTLPLAELASTFGEMLVFESVVSKASPKDKLAIYAAKIEHVFATVFRQSALYRFEQRSHAARREQGELNAEQFGEIWQEELQAMFGNSVKLGEQHRDWWMYISHFFHTPFYVYAYSFGELLVLSLYQMAKAEGDSFSGRYIELLRKGGSESPNALMASVGIDIDSEQFWEGGFAAMEKLVAEFERLWSEYSSS